MRAKTDRKPRRITLLPRIRRILVPTDFSAASVDALGYAQPFARETGARLDVLHVVPPLIPPPEMAPYSGEWDQIGREQRLEASQQLKKLVAAHVQTPVRPRLLVREGEAAPVICAVAEAERSDLLVIATRGQTGLARFVMGSTAEDVVQRAPCPVLTVRQRSLPRQGASPIRPSEQINHILVPIDFSAPSRAALHYAADFARRFTASLVLLHVAAHLSVSSRLAYLTTRLHAVVVERGLAQLTALARRHLPRDIRVEVIVRTGTPADVITQVSRREKADLIILGTRGQGGLRRLLMGGTATRVVRHAPCPVLVVR
jgi:nucleotide-binding universal stress UspA family protein